MDAGLDGACIAFAAAEVPERLAVAEDEVEAVVLARVRGKRGEVRLGRSGAEQVIGDEGAARAGRGALVWFGIFIVLLVEIAEVTPPVGFNLFVLQNMTGKDSSEIARAAIPFFSMLVLTIAIISVFPQVVTWLPDAVMGAAKK